jgi:NADH-quinone oxidoreductase subunit J
MGVDWEAVAFVVLSALEVLFSLLLVTSKRLVRAAFWLAGTLITIGGIYLLFRAEFVFLIQILVYAGAVPLLFAFGIMVTRRKIMEEPAMEEHP